MSMEPVSRNTGLYELEMRISETAARQSQEAFGDEAHEISEENPLFPRVNETLTELLKDFPAASNGKKYINTHCVITPKLIVKCRLPTTSEKTSDKKIDFGPLIDPVLGNLTTDNISLKLKNIRKINSRARDTNEHQQASPQLTDSQKILINKDTTIGYTDTQQKIRKTEILADVKFGTLLKAKNLTLETVKAKGENLEELTVDLPPLYGKIEADGSVTFNNGLKLTLQQLENLICEPDIDNFINHTFEIDAPFVPT